MTWTRGRRELCFSGRLPLEQGVAFEQAIWNIAKPQRALDKQAGTSSTGSSPPRTRSSRSPASRRRRGRREAQPHHPDRAPQRRRAAAPRGRRAAQPRDRRAAHLRRAPPHDQTQRPRPRALTRRTLRLLRTASRAAQALSGHCQYPGCTATRELEAHHLIPVEHGGKTELDNLILLCPRHHKLLHDHHIHTSGNADTPPSQTSRTRDHHQPTTRTTPLTGRWRRGRRRRARRPGVALSSSRSTTSRSSSARVRRLSSDPRPRRAPAGGRGRS